MIKKLLLPLSALLLAQLACGGGPRQTATLPSPSPTVPSTSATPTTDLARLWRLLLGGPKADQGWGVDVDSAGNVYLAAFEQKSNQLFTDMAIYKLTPDGDQFWRTEWGGANQEKAFVVAVAEPVVYVGGLTHTAIGLTQADMAVLALDADTGRVLWEYTWGQGFGYEEVDGLVVDGDSIYISGWTESDKTGYDIAVLKLDLEGQQIWENVWGTDGFDTADGKIMVTEDSLYVSGRANGINMFAGGQAVVVRFSKETGEHLQHATWGESGLADGLGMTSDGVSLYVMGINFKPGRGNQIMLLKYDRDLNLLWERIWGEESGEHVGRAAGADEAGNVLLGVNSRETNNSLTDIFLLKYDPQGQLLWESRWGDADEEVVHGLVVAGDFVYLAGLIKFNGANPSDTLLLKADSRSGQFPVP